MPLVPRGKRKRRVVLLELGFDLELDGVVLPLLGQRNLGFLGDAAPAVSQLKLDGLAGRAPHAEGEAVAAVVEFGRIAEVVVEAGALAEVTGHAADAAAAGAVGENLLLQPVAALAGSSRAMG